MMHVPWKHAVCLCMVMLFLPAGCARRKPAEPDKASKADSAGKADAAQETVTARKAAIPDGAVPAAQPSLVPSPLVGRWHSVKLEGEDIGNFIKEIRYTFGADGSCVAEAAMTDGAMERKQGAFRVEGDQLYQVVEGDSLKGRFELNDGVLIIHDPFLDSRVWFERDGAGNPATGP